MLNESIKNLYREYKERCNNLGLCPISITEWLEYQ